MTNINQHTSIGYALGYISGMASTMEILAKKHVSGAGDDARATGILVPAEDFRELVVQIQSTAQMYLELIDRQPEFDAGDYVPRADYEALKREAEIYRSDLDRIARRYEGIVASTKLGTY
jgi:hypothetical protein